MQLIFLSYRCRRDCQTAVAFLTTHVRVPDEDDWGKLKRVLKYLKGTHRLVLTLEADDLAIIKLWVDAYFQAHDDCKGHTGSIMSLGREVDTSFSRKQKFRARPPLRMRLLASTSPFYKHSGENSLLKPRAALSITTSFIKITKVLSY